MIVGDFNSGVYIFCGTRLIGEILVSMMPCIFWRLEFSFYILLVFLELETGGFLAG